MSPGKETAVLWEKNLKVKADETTARKSIQRERERARWRKEAKAADARASKKRLEKEAKVRARAKNGKR